MIWQYIKHLICYFHFYFISLYTYATMIQLVTYLLFQLFKSYMFSTDMCCFHGFISLRVFRFIDDSSLFYLSTIHQWCLYTVRIRVVMWLISVYLRLYFITIYYFYILLIIWNIQLSSLYQYQISQTLCICLWTISVSLCIWISCYYAITITIRYVDNLSNSEFIISIHCLSSNIQSWLSISVICQL